MPASLQPATGPDLVTWMTEEKGRYVEARVASGERPELAAQTADSQFAAYFPDGRLAPGHLVFRVRDEAGEPVGWLWLGPSPSGGEGAWWVFNVEIEPEHRGRGHGRTAMLLAEAEVRTRGGHELGLNVFGANLVARGLYESLGYQPSAIQMRKPV